MFFTRDCDQNHSFTIPDCVGCRQLLVNIRSKFVALFLLVGLLAGPATALARCWMAAPVTSHQQCHPGCLGMASTGHPSQAKTRQSSSGCCEITPARSREESLGFVPSGIENGTPVVQTTSTANISFARTPITHVSDVGPTPPLFPSQSVLCTFLI